MTDRRHVSCAIDDAVAHIELVSAETRNGMVPAFVEEFELALDQIDTDPGVRAVLITARGSSFCVGGDLAYFRSNLDDLGPVFTWMVEHWHATLARLAALPVPVVTAIHGGTAGGGLGLVWCADVVLASTDTRIACGFADIGLSGDGGSSWYLPRLVGQRRAQLMILDNLAIDARTAEEWGVVSRLVEPGELLDDARATAARLARRSATAMSRAKRLLLETWDRGLVDQLAAECAAIQECAVRSDVVSGVGAFVERRPAVFTDGYDR